MNYKKKGRKEPPSKKENTVSSVVVARDSNNAVYKNLRKDPIYRIMHAQPRSDILEVKKSKFALAHCERAATYFENSFMENPLRRLRMQIGSNGPSGFFLLYPKIFHHWRTLRLLDLARNNLDEEDIVNICNGMRLGEKESSLEVIDFSYNCRIGNSGAFHLLQQAASNDTLRTVLLKGTGLDDGCAEGIHTLLRQRPPPKALDDGVVTLRSSGSGMDNKFFLNLNENYFGSTGTIVLSRQLPSHISLTMSKQKFRTEHHKLKQ